MVLGEKYLGRHTAANGDLGGEAAEKCPDASHIRMNTLTHNM